MKLTVYCIAKNEADAMPGMLDSVKQIVDEIIVCDTGSSDNTIEVAKQYTDKVYVHPKSDEWRQNRAAFSFAEARNYVLDQFDTEDSHPDWILSMDCDERLDAESAAGLREYLENLPQHVELVLPSIVMERDSGGEYQRFMAERVWRGGKNIRFEGAMHNYLNVECDERRVGAPNLLIRHNRTVKGDSTRDARAQQRPEMAEYHFLRKIEEDPNDRRSMFYLAGTYFDCQEYEKAIEWFTKYLEVSDWDEEIYQSAYLLSRAYLEVGKTQEAYQVARKYVAYDWRRAELLLMIGELAKAQGDAHQAERWFKYASLQQMHPSPMFVERDAHTWMPHVNLWELYSETGHNDKAAEHGRLAIELGTPNTPEILRWEKNHTQYGDSKILCLVDRGQMDFLQPLVDSWQFESAWCPGRQVTVMDTVLEQLPETDIIWCEWAGDLAVELTNRPEKPARVIVRVHGYETHTGHLQKVNWSNVDDVIFVADYLRDLAVEQCPDIQRWCNIYVVPGGVETGEFSIGEGKTGTKIAMACYGNYKKNLPLALQIMAELPDKYTLHVATEWQDHRTQMYVEHMIGELGLRERVTFYPWESDLNAFYADKDFYLSCSIEESFHYSLAEAMAAGLKPVIHCWKSATDFYPEEWIFKTVSEAVDMILLPPFGAAEDYRNYAVEHLDISENVRRIWRIIDRPSVAVLGEPKSKHAMEYKLTRALERLGCRTDSPNPKVAIIMGINAQALDEAEGAYKVLWHAEQVGGDDEHAVQRRKAIEPLVPKVDLVVTHSPHSIPVYESMGAKKVIHIPLMGAVEPFRRLDVEKQYDVGFCGHINERRKRILEELAKHYEVAGFTNYDHEQVNYFYNKCKIVLNLHCTDEPNLETRLAEAMASGACVLTEPLPEGHPIPDTCIVQSTELAKRIGYLLEDQELRQRIADNAYGWAWRRYRLEHNAEKLLDRLGEQL